MQSMEDKKVFIAYAQKIGDALIADSNGKIDWEAIDDPVNSANEYNISLYTGISGVLLYFGQLYGQTGEPKYFSVLEDGLNWLKKNKIKYEQKNYSFYAGQLGIVYTLTQISKLVPVNQKAAYLDLALEITEKASAHQYKIAEHVTDLIGGIAGMIIALLHLHSCRQEAWIIKDIQLLFRSIIERTSLSKAGIFWERNPKHKNGLCGFAHGASGFAFVFLELGSYFKNKAFYKLAELTLAHENLFYDAEIMDWIDLRYLDEELEWMAKSYRDTRQINFDKKKKMTAWCHGAPGIGLTRLRAFELTKEKQYLKGLESALLKTKAFFEKPTGLCLCHGITGNALLFLELYKRLEDDRYLEFSVNIGKSLAKELPPFGLANFAEKITSLPVYSLFLGQMGLGYFMLQLANPLTFDSVLFPAINDSYQGPANYLTDVSFLDVSNELYLVCYPKSYVLLDEKIRTPIGEIPSENFVEALGRSFQNSIKAKASSAINEIFKIEQNKLLSLANVEDNATLEIVDRLEKERNKEKLKQDINSLVLKLSKTIQLFENTRNWGGSNWRTAESEEEGPYYLVCKLTAKGVVEYQINWFTFLVLSSTQEAGTIKEISEKVKQELIDFQIDDLDRLIQAQIEEVLKEALVQVI